MSLINNNPFFQKPVIVDKKRDVNSYEMRDLDDAGRKTTGFKTIINIPKIVEKQLQPGDIILSYCDDVKSWKDIAIPQGQRLEGDSDGISHRYCHAAIYVGNGEIVEAIDGRKEDGIDIKINKLTGRRFAKNQDEYRVFRPKKELVERIAGLGRAIAKADNNEKKLTGKYSYKDAIFSIVRDPKKITRSSVASYFKAAYFAHTGEIPQNVNGPQNFHCSYLAAWLLQASESEDVIRKINDDLPADKKIQFPNVSNLLTEEEKVIAIDAWADRMSEEHMLDIVESSSIKLNPQATTAQQLLNYLLDHPTLFDYNMRIVPLKKEAEKK
jgi:hypothetical protein